MLDEKETKVQPEGKPGEWRGSEVVVKMLEKQPVNPLGKLEFKAMPRVWEDKVCQ